MDMLAEITERARELGFTSLGVSAPELALRSRQRLAELISLGQHGEMGWMAENQDRRSDPKVLWPEVKSVLVLAVSYAPAVDPLDILQHRDRAAISVYARNKDYHDVIKKRLRQLARWMRTRWGGEVKVFVDTAPVMEKPLAVAAGLGWQGKHTNLLNREHGNWLFLSEIFTTLELPVSTPERDHCGSCRACQDICPTRAFPKPYTLDPSRCLSYLTIEHKGPIPEEFRKPMGNRIYGCDDCLAVCPWNKFAQSAKEAAFLPRIELTAPRLADFLDLDDESFRQLFSGSPIRRLKWPGFLRNVLIALGNSKDRAMVGKLRLFLGHTNPVVQDAAHWAVAQLTQDNPVTSAPPASD